MYRFINNNRGPDEFYLNRRGGYLPSILILVGESPDGK